MGNEILAIILWVASIAVAWVIAYLLIITIAAKAVERFSDNDIDSPGGVFKQFWPVIAVWGGYVIWAIIALVNAAVHVFLAIQIGVEMGAS